MVSPQRMASQHSFILVLVSLVSLSIFSSAALAQPAARAPSGLEAWRASRADTCMNDFGELAHYRDENARMNPPAPGEKRVAFFGDSITALWPLADYFGAKPYVNRGISGQTTSQMLVRFHQDVVDLHPAAVVILAGTNDIAGNTGPISLEDIEANYASLADLAVANGIKVIFASVLPVHNYTPQSQEPFSQRSPAKIRQLNQWLIAYCSAHRMLYLDYFDVLADDRGLLRKELAEDGLHPNGAGYKIMAPLAQSAIESVLDGKAKASEPANRQ